MENKESISNFLQISGIIFSGKSWYIVSFPQSFSNSESRCKRASFKKRNLLSSNPKKSFIIFLSKMKIHRIFSLDLIASISHLLSKALKSCLNQKIEFLYIYYF